VDARTIVFGAIGAALYAVLGQFQVALPGTQSVSIRPAFALVMFVAFAFGPIAGASAGLVGNALLDQISGWGLTTSWNWSVANGLAALAFGVLAVGVASSDRWSFAKTALLGSIGVAIGFLFVATDIWLLGITFAVFVAQNYVPVVISNVIAVAVLTPILVRAWEPLAERIGR
jgi:energy-coupling factor transport system substrate-specific component